VENWLWKRIWTCRYKRQQNEWLYFVIVTGNRPRDMRRNKFICRCEIGARLVTRHVCQPIYNSAQLISICIVYHWSYGLLHLTGGCRHQRNVYHILHVSVETKVQRYQIWGICCCGIGPSRQIHIPQYIGRDNQRTVYRCGCKHSCCKVKSPSSWFCSYVARFLASQGLCRRWSEVCCCAYGKNWTVIGIFGG
jgi:hypothetical protein